MDNAPWHKKAIRLIADEHLDEYSDVFDKIEFIKLPPNSPDLNPIEQIWRITRRENTHHQSLSLQLIKRSKLGPRRTPK